MVKDWEKEEHTEKEDGGGGQLEGREEKGAWPRGVKPLQKWI